MINRVCFFLLFLVCFSVHAESSALIVSAYHQTTLRAGPGHTYGQIGIVYPGTEMQILERNHTGTWVYTHRENELGQVTEGWVLSGFLNLPSTLKFSDIPVNDMLPDADLTRLFSSALVKLYSAPVIPEVSSRMKRIYARGQQLGNHPDVVTKIGDSVSADPEYLIPMSREGYDLGAYDYLEETLSHFGASTTQGSIAARIGLTSVSVFDPLWATDPRCESGETPVACEYRLKQPSVALIMFGANDMRLVNSELYKEQMRGMIHESFQRGIIPVLSTFSFDEETEFYWQAVNNNVALVELAEEYQIPLINLYAASRVLPNYGLEADDVHFTHSGWETLKFSNGHDVWYGTTLQNLLTLRMLDEIRRTVGMN